LKERFCLDHGLKQRLMLLFDGYYDNVEELKLNQEENVLNLFVHLLHYYPVKKIFFYVKKTRNLIFCLKGIRSIREYFELKVKSDGNVYFIER
jgi:hypothetical protein